MENEVETSLLGGSLVLVTPLSKKGVMGPVTFGDNR